MKAVLVELRPYDPVTAGRVTLRICNVDDVRVTQVEGGPGEFLPLLAAGPLIQRSVFNGDFTGMGETGDSGLGVALDEGSAHQWMNYVWGDADVTIWVGEIGDPFSSYVKKWTVNAVSISRPSPVRADIVLRRPARFNRPVLYLSFAGTDDGDSGDTGEGRAEIRGQFKPWLAGYGRYVPPLVIDPARQIYCYHGYGPTGGATECFEGGISKGAPDYTWTTFAAMRDAVMTSGEWGHCPSLGMIRLGGQPSFPVTIHAGGDAPSGTVLTKVGDIAKRLLEGPGGIPAPAIPASNLSDFNTLRPQPVDMYLPGSISVEVALSALVASVNGYWLENEDGQVILGTVQLSGATPTTTIDLDGRDAPTVMGAAEEAAGVPIYRYRLGARRTHLVHRPNDVAGAIERAQSTADSKAYVFPASDLPPSVPTPLEGDLWPDTSTGITVMRRFNGAAWELVAEVGTNTSLLPLGSVEAMEIVGNSFKRLDAGTGYTHAVRTTVAFGGSAFIRCGAVPSGYTVVSLDDNTTATALADMNWTLVAHDTGTWTLYAAGVEVATGNTGAPIVTDTNIELRYDGPTVKAIISATVVHTAPATAGLTYYGKVHAYQVGQVRQIIAGYAGITPMLTNTPGQSPIVDSTGAPVEAVDVITVEGDIGQIIGASEILVPTDNAGVLSGSSPYATKQFKLFELENQITSGITWTLDSPAGATATVTGTGTATVQITGLTVNEVEFTLTASRANRQDRYIKFKVRKNIAPPPVTGSGGTSGSTASQTSGFLLGIVTTTMEAITNELAITVGSGASVTLATSLDMLPAADGAPGGNWTPNYRWYRWNGSAYVAVGTQFSGSTAYENYSPGYTDGEGYYNPPENYSDPSNVSNSQNYTSSAGASEKFKLYAALDSGSKDMTFTGQVSATG